MRIAARRHRVNFLFSHDGHTFEKHSECAEGQTTQVLCDEADHAQVEEQQPLEPSGDTE